MKQKTRPKKQAKRSAKPTTTNAKALAGKATKSTISIATPTKSTPHQGSKKSCTLDAKPYITAEPVQPIPVAPTDFPFGANVVKCLPCVHCGGPVNPAELYVVIEWGERADGMRHLGRPAKKVAHDKCDREHRGIKPRIKKDEEPTGKEPAKQTKKERAATAVRKSGSFDGLKLFKKVKENPRKPGTHGFNSFNVLKDGMSYEAYISAGGRPNDLRWDVDHNWVEAR